MIRLLTRVILPAAFVAAAGAVAMSAIRSDPSPSPSSPRIAAPAPLASPRSEQGPRIWYPAGQYPRPGLPDGEQRVVKSVLNVPRTMHFGDYVWNEEHVPREGETWVRIDLAHQLLSVFRDGHEIGSAVIIYGTDGKPTPTGIFPIMEKQQDHYSSLYDAEMPFMLRLTGDGVAIHASNVRRGFATHGCIGVPRAFAAMLFAAVKRGDVVAILPPAGTPARKT